MLDTDSLESFLISNDVENIFICGCAWDICVRDRPLGYLKVFDLIKKLGLKTNLLVKYNCVKNMDDSYFKLEKNLGWHPTEMPGVFRYGPEELV